LPRVWGSVINGLTVNGDEIGGDASIVDEVFDDCGVREREITCDGGDFASGRGHLLGERTEARGEWPECV